MGEKCQPIYFFVCDIKNKTDKLFNLMKKKKKEKIWLGKDLKIYTSSQCYSVSFITFLFTTLTKWVNF